MIAKIFLSRYVEIKSSSFYSAISGFQTAMFINMLETPYACRLSDINIVTKICMIKLNLKDPKDPQDLFSNVPHLHGPT